MFTIDKYVNWVNCPILVGICPFTLGGGFQFIWKVPVQSTGYVPILPISIIAKKITHFILPYQNNPIILNHWNQKMKHQTLNISLPEISDY